MVKKFLVLCDIAKKDVQKHEVLLMHNIRLINIEKQNIDLINIEIATMKPPPNGSFKDFISYKANLNGFLYQIEEIKDKIANLKISQTKIKNDLRIANINYEKMLYVYNQHKDALDKKIQEAESKNLDELSLMLHNNTAVKG